MTKLQKIDPIPERADDGLSREGDGAKTNGSVSSSAIPPVSPADTPAKSVTPTKVTTKKITAKKGYAEGAERSEQPKPDGDNPQDLKYGKKAVQSLRSELKEAQAQLHTMTVERDAADKGSTVAKVAGRSALTEPGATRGGLEKGREELQVLNEELLALNDGLRNKIDEINGVNRDLQNLMNATEIGTIFLDTHLCVKRYTPRVEDLFDIAEADLGRPLHHLNNGFGSDSLADDAAQVLRKLVMVEREMQHTANHQWFLIRLLPSYTAEEKVAGVVITFVDITERKKYDEQLEMLINSLEEMVAARAEQVTQLAFDVSLAEQAERQRIAQILHDDLQQLLHALRLDIEVLSGGLSPGQTDLLGQANSLICQAIETTRTLTVDLSPPVLKGDEFTIALEWLAIQMNEMHGLNVDVVAPASVRLPAALRSLVYQMVRELLFNVVKHADVDHARVVMRRRGDELDLVVSDEGSGFKMEQEQAPSQQGGFGLRSVMQRLDLIGGRLEMDASPGCGTRAQIILPLTKHGNQIAGTSLKQEYS